MAMGLVFRLWCSGFGPCPSASLSLPGLPTSEIRGHVGWWEEMGIPDHLTCLLRNLYAGQEVTVRTGHGTTDWFQIGKGVLQGCILSPCLFNFYAEYVCVKLYQSCLPLCNPMDCSPQGFSVYGILQARILE